MLLAFFSRDKDTEVRDFFCYYLSYSAEMDSYLKTGVDTRTERMGEY